MKVTPLLQVSAALWILWGVLHLWVPFDGLSQLATHGVKGGWEMFIGGAAVSKSAFKHASDKSTLLAHEKLIQNFVIDVGGYGLFGIYVAYKMLTQPSWEAYLLGVIIIGIADLAFTFSCVTSGVIEISFPVLLGPIVWVIAVIVNAIALTQADSRNSTKKA